MMLPTVIIATKLVIGAFTFMFMYRFHGQQHAHLNDTVVRLIFALTVPCIMIWLTGDPTSHPYILLSPIPIYIAISAIPHSFCQSMGQNLVPQKKWPVFFLPTYTQTEWTNLTPNDKVWYCVIGCAAVGLLSGLITFLPALLDFPISKVYLAVGTLYIGWPTAYYLGYQTKSSITIANTPFTRGTEWAEAYIGLVYFIAFLQLNLPITTKF